MYELNWTESEIEDLKEDFLVNSEEFFWEFIKENVETAYYLGIHFDQWFKLLPDIDRKYLYSQGARHCNDELVDLQDQITFWISKFNSLQDTNQVDMVEMSEYILNHIILQPEDEYLIVNIAFFLGKSTGKVLFSNEVQEDKQSNTSN